MKLTVSIQIDPSHGEMKDMRNAWVKAEELGADALYTADHFHAVDVGEDTANRKTVDGEYGKADVNQSSFEGGSILAAMAATTTRARIGCLCHAIGYRNPNLLADMARTIDHISGGRFILGMGTGYFKKDYEEYGYEFGTAVSRAQDMARGIPIIKARLGKLNPPPLGPLPIMVATMGENIGMRVTAEHADMWHVYGPIDKIRQKIASMKAICKEVGRDFSDLELMTFYWPAMGLDKDPAVYLNEGIRNIVLVCLGPKYDLGELREILQWRDSLPASA